MEGIIAIVLGLIVGAFLFSGGATSKKDQKTSYSMLSPCPHCGEKSAEPWRNNKSIYRCLRCGRVSFPQGRLSEEQIRIKKEEELALEEARTRTEEVFPHIIGTIDQAQSYLEKALEEFKSTHSEICVDDIFVQLYLEFYDTKVRFKVFRYVLRWFKDGKSEELTICVPNDYTSRPIYDYGTNYPSASPAVDHEMALLFTNYWNQKKAFPRAEQELCVVYMNWSHSFSPFQSEKDSIYRSSSYQE